MDCFLYILFSFFSFSSQNEVEIEGNIQEDPKLPVIIDTMPHANAAIETDYMLRSINRIIYIGRQFDTIVTNKTYDYFFTLYLDFESYLDSTYSKSGLEIFAGHSQILTIDLEEYTIPPPPPPPSSKTTTQDSLDAVKLHEAWLQRPRDYIQAMPVFIFNHTRDTVYLEIQNTGAIMIQEAKDKNGDWKPIEYWRHPSCGNSYGAVGLLPDDMVVVKTPQYSGDFETELRFKLKNGSHIIYSDAFVGKINKAQFELPEQKKYMLKYDSYDWIFLNK